MSFWQAFLLLLFLAAYSYLLGLWVGKRLERARAWPLTRFSATVFRALWDVREGMPIEVTYYRQGRTFYGRVTGVNGVKYAVADINKNLANELDKYADAKANQNGGKR